MTKQSGQNNYKGVNAQAWAAMSLFLQQLRDQNFSYIQLEAPGFQDFNLVFKDEKKIICESKARSKPINYGDIKKILSIILSKKTIEDRDEILIICTALDKKLASDVANIKYWSSFIAPKFKKKGFTDAQITILEKVRFWVVNESENHLVVYSLFGELLGFWLPGEELETKADSILIKKIYSGSSRGEKFSREDIVKEIKKISENAKKYSGYFDDARVKTEIQFNNLLDALENSKSPVWASGQLAAISAKPALTSFLLDRLSQKKIKKLSDWSEVWKLYKVYRFSFTLSRIFEQNIDTLENKEFILDFLKNRTKNLRRFYQSDFFDVDVVKIVTKIIEGPDGIKYFNDAFAIIKDLITFNEKEFFYLKDSGYNRGEWEKGEICKLLHKIYTRADATLKQKVFDLLISGFNVTEDDGEFIHHAPTDVYGILREWLDDDFRGRFNKIVKLASDQYQRYYKKFGSKVEFKGWEHMGGGTSFGPGGHHVGDRHFVGFILAPAIRKYYDADKIKGWKFIKQECITATAKVSKVKPDFLNRSVYEIVLDRYADSDKKISNEAFVILKEYILSGKGIPRKSDLIYQAIAGSSLLDDKKWRLVNLTIKKYGIPVNPFSEQIVADLAKKNYQPAKITLKQWFADPKYYKHFMFDLDSVSSIRVLLDDDLDFAAELFKTLITSDYIKNGKSDHFGAYTVAALLNEIIRKDYAIGLSIIRLLESEEKLSDDQQIVYSFSLFNHQGNDDSDSQELLLKIYNEVVNPFLKKYDNDVIKIRQRLTDANCREAFVQFAARLATKQRMTDALRIVRVFVNDPDPYLPGEDPHDPEDKYNEHKSVLEGKEPSSIASVRGWCGWVLMKCSVLDGRSQVLEVIELTKKLINDQNYYVVHMACFALEQIACNRLTVLPSNRDILFFNDDRKTALLMAKDVEKIAFNLLERFTKWPKEVQKALSKSILHVFDPIRAINKKGILKLLTFLSQFSSEAIEEAAPLFLFYAELRVDAYKDWKFAMPGLYDDLIINKKDAEEFKKIMLDVIKRLQKEDVEKCFHFASSAEHLMRDGWKTSEEKDRYTEIALEHFNILTNIYSHNIFNLIYMVLEKSFESKDEYTNQWISLLIKCLRIEDTFYKEQVQKGNARNVSWYPALYHSRILERLHQNISPEKFIDAARVFFFFPKEIDIHESTELVSIIQKMPKSNSDRKKIIKTLRDRNPSKYWELK